VILSKPDLMKDFDGQRHNENVGIHEFVHLLDKEDGVIDGIPETLLKHQFVGPWLYEIKSEIKKIEEGKSDINPYALTNNAEFLAVVSEYFFSNPDAFKNKHPELYEYLAAIFKQDGH
jgi:Mlc titration factor MtfA (ptsG expression regulator)